MTDAQPIFHPSSRTSRLLVSVLILRSAHARLRLVNSTSGQVIPGSKSWETQRFISYNSHTATTVTGPGISAAGLTYMDGTKCELATEGSPAFEALRGKVVFGGIWGNENLECQPVFDPFFDLLRKAGALGYVGFDPYSPPGADCFDHCKISGLKPTMP